MTTALFTRTASERRTGRPRDHLTLGAACVVALFILLAVLGPLLAPHDPNTVDPLNVNAGPSATHLLGTDDTGRDLLSRLIAGTRASLAAPAVVIAVSTTLGTLLALAAAWFGGRLDRFLSGALDIVFGFPGLIMAVLVAAVFGAGLTAPIVALSIAYLPSRAMRPPRKPCTAWPTRSAPSPESSPAAAAHRGRSPRSTNFRAGYGCTARSPAPAARSHRPWPSPRWKTVSWDAASSASRTKDHPATATAASAPCSSTN
ncbi:ABC transporter permease [Streptomyces sp. ISL-36]|uniref:ABC transporter permease n=1 Tax=Streptomyces sp. ISL-36 TaxID=2819182 RepID=UPI002035A4DD|nr:hypothetical protein [Streptomyces sp. ISL-36]